MGKIKWSVMLSQRLMLTPTTDTVDMATDVATTVVTAEDTTEDTMGRGLPSLLLQLNLALRLNLVMATDVDTMVVTDIEATTAGTRRRGLQIPTMDTDIAVATTATVDTVEDTGAELNRLLTLSLNFTLATFLIPLKLLIVTTYT